MRSDDAQLESVVGAARNPLNWLARAEGHMKTAELLTDAWLSSVQRMSPGRVASFTISNYPGVPRHVQTRDGEIDHLNEMIGYGQAAMFHQCLAIENLLKGILVARDPQSWVKAGPRRLYEWRHDVRTLVRAAEIEVTPELELRLDNVTRFIEWAGRYPTAMTPAVHGGGATWSSDEVGMLGAFAAQLRDALRKESGLHDPSELNRAIPDGSKTGETDEEAGTDTIR